ASCLSPAYAADAPPDAFFSWVGIIMYLPTSDPAQRKAITDRFFEYRGLAKKNLWTKYGAVEHWAKVELPDGMQVQSRASHKFLSTKDHAMQNHHKNVNKMA
ncbi:hypothetical protein CYMTET_14457, partial [Cymbomonas tetramitiformis]